MPVFTAPPHVCSWPYIYILNYVHVCACNMFLLVYIRVRVCSFGVSVYMCTCVAGCALLC